MRGGEEERRREVEKERRREGAKERSEDRRGKACTINFFFRPTIIPYLIRLEYLSLTP